MRRLKPTRYIRPGSIKVADKLSDAVAYLPAIPCWMRTVPNLAMKPTS